jgi:Xaa-Pro aminopeptidase
MERFVQDRLTQIRSQLAARGAQALLVTDPASVRYLSAFGTPEDARILITPDSASLLTDFRYELQAAEESLLPPVILENWLDEVPGLVGDVELAIEADHLTVSQQRRLEAELGRATLPLTAVFRELRVRKAPHEIELLRRAARITDLAFEHILGFLRPGVSEVDVSLELERVMRSHGAEGSSFTIIVAGGHRSAMPHGTASGRIIEAGDLVTLDFGALVDGYHADMTRAVAVGEIDSELRRMYDAVLEAERAAVAALRPGVEGAAVDALARRILASHGLEQFFTHSLGHGVGTQIHEEPRLSRRSTDVLAPGMVVTVEPGVYINGKGGVRIEDLCLITESGHERLSQSPTDFVQV